MPQPRIPLQAEQTYHIWTHANGSESLFRCKENFRYFLERYRYHVHPVVETFAYCLMPNHLHLMVRVRKEEELRAFFLNKIKDKPISPPYPTGFENLSGMVSQQFSNLFNSYTKAYNKLYERKGSLFTRSFNRKNITSDAYFVRLIAYIHNNPVHHGFVQAANDWMFSSWHAYLQDKRTSINKIETMKWFENMDNFKLIHKELNHEKAMRVFEV